MTDLKAFNQYLPERLADVQDFTAYAPSNIALSKYWGKRDHDLNLPLNSSLSVSLRDWGSTTRILPSEDGQDRVWLNDEELSTQTAFHRKVVAFAERFRRGQRTPIHFKTTNSIPTAAGLASSASGFAALTQALVGAFGLNLDASQQSLLARFGSGSATRSIWHGFVRWDRGLAADGSDSFAQPLPTVWPEFRIAIVPVDTGPKAHTSRDGMNHTVATSPLFATWPEQAEKDCAQIEAALIDKNFAELGALAEANALAMHATMMAARPSLTYLKPQSWTVLERLWQARRDGLGAYATMDAGANVKLLFLDSQTRDIEALFPEAQIIAPFDGL